MLFGYSSVSGLQSFPPLVTRLRGLHRGFRHRKVKKKIGLIASLSFA